MTGRGRWMLFLALLAASIVVSVGATLYFRTPMLALLLFFPFLPFFFGGRRHKAWTETKACPTCGLQTDDPAISYCPRDGSRLQSPEPQRSP